MRRRRPYKRHIWTVTFGTETISGIAASGPLGAAQKAVELWQDEWPTTKPDMRIPSELECSVRCERRSDDSPGDNIPEWIRVPIH